MTDIALILAGGRGTRMGGRDKGLVEFAGRRLIDHVLDRLTPQVDGILISGTHNYGTRWPAIADRDDGPAGPVAGLWAASCWLQDHRPQATHFVSAPVDAPLLPGNLVERLKGADGSSVAVANNRVQATFARWRISALKKVIADRQTTNPSLQSIAEALGAVKTPFADVEAFTNINAPDDLKRLQSANPTRDKRG